MFFSSKKNEFITGNEAVIRGAQDAGVEFMAGYPITPATEILEGWAELVAKQNKDGKYKVIQAEDEISAGFNVIGAILAGKKAFTATAGVGHILMQDPITMAEAMRLPFVGIIMQRGGPSTGTVIYSQQEVTLACFGGNGESLRIVYSVANPQELYDYTIKAFDMAWRHRLPTFVLGDGYQSRMKRKVVTSSHKSSNIKAILGDEKTYVNIRNCYNFEHQLYEQLSKQIDNYKTISPQIVESQEYRCEDANEIIFAHGIVASAAKQAVDILRTEFKRKIGLFRPITLRPFPDVAASRIAAKAHRIIIFESSDGHFTRIIKDKLYGLTKIETYLKPVMTISTEDIINKIKSISDEFWTEH